MFEFIVNQVRLVSTTNPGDERKKKRRKKRKAKKDEDLAKMRVCWYVLLGMYVRYGKSRVNSA